MEIEKDDHFVFVPVEGRHMPVVAFCPEKLNPAARERIRDMILTLHTKFPPHAIWEFWLENESKEPKFITMWLVG